MLSTPAGKGERTLMETERPRVPALEISGLDWPRGGGLGRYGRYTTGGAAALERVIRITRDDFARLAAAWRVADHRQIIDGWREACGRWNWYIRGHQAIDDSHDHEPSQALADAFRATLNRAIHVGLSAEFDPAGAATFVAAWTRMTEFEPVEPDAFGPLFVDPPDPWAAGLVIGSLLLANEAPLPSALEHLWAAVTSSIEPWPIDPKLTAPPPEPASIHDAAADDPPDSAYSGEHVVSNATGPNERKLLFGMSIPQSALWTVFLFACAVTSMLMSLWPILTIVASLEAVIVGGRTIAAYRARQAGTRWQADELERIRTSFRIADPFESVPLVEATSAERSDESWSPTPWPTIAQEVVRVTEWLQQTVEQAGVGLPTGVVGIHVGPAEAPTPPPYGTRRGTWAEAVSFVNEWAREGRAWVNLGLRISARGEPYLVYEVQHRDYASEPLPDGASPALNLAGPAYDHPVQSPV
jgi:hypothetical protein